LSAAANHRLGFELVGELLHPENEAGAIQKCFLGVDLKLFLGPSIEVPIALLDSIRTDAGTAAPIGVEA
jgi:hypothetical protein